MVFSFSMSSLVFCVSFSELFAVAGKVDFYAIDGSMDRWIDGFLTSISVSCETRITELMATSDDLYWFSEYEVAEGTKKIFRNF